MLVALGWRVSPVSASCARSVPFRQEHVSSGAVARRSQGLAEEWSVFRVYGEVNFSGSGF